MALTFLNELILSAKTQDLLTVEATVDTGFEPIAEQECRGKLGSELPIHQCQGRVYFNIDKSKFSTVSILKLFNIICLC